MGRFSVVNLYLDNISESWSRKESFYPHRGITPKSLRFMPQNSTALIQDGNKSLWGVWRALSLCSCSFSIQNLELCHIQTPHFPSLLNPLGLLVCLPYYTHMHRYWALNLLSAQFLGAVLCMQLCIRIFVLNNTIHLPHRVTGGRGSYLECKFWTVIKNYFRLPWWWGAKDRGRERTTQGRRKSCWGHGGLTGECDGLRE